MTEKEEHRAAPAAPISVAGPWLSRAAWVRILPFLAYLFFIIAGDLLERLGFSSASLRWLYPIKIGAVALLLAIFWRQYSELRSTSLGPLMALVAVAVGVIVLVLWVSLDADWMIFGSVPGFDPRTHGQLNWAWIAIRIAGAALVVPVMEELFWRSFLMRWIEDADFEKVDPSQAGKKSFTITIVLFGLEHNLWLAGMVAGAAYSALFMRHRRLWSPILAHAVTNALLGMWVVSTKNWSYW